MNRYWRCIRRKLWIN